MACLGELAPLDVIVANHVLYFWHRPAGELTAIHGCLRRGGLLALGYPLRQHMPPMAQKHIPQQGHLLYESVEDVARLPRSAGFSAVSHQVQGPPAARRACRPRGRLNATDLRTGHLTRRFRHTQARLECCAHPQPPASTTSHRQARRRPPRSHIHRVEPAGRRH